ncbi:MAG: hypothetical protein Q4C54_07965 [Clostridia bacterium]|nr:hypothetical protein [Clostridia bacterium]
MKKLIALMMLLVCLPVMAETSYTFNPLGLKLTVPDTMVEEDISDAEDEDLALMLLSEDESLLLTVYLADADGVTVQDVQAELAGEEGVTSSGITVINGIETYFMVGRDDDGDDYVAYLCVNNDQLAEFTFYFAGDAAAAVSGEIMGTLCAAE